MDRADGFRGMLRRPSTGTKQFGRTILPAVHAPMRDDPDGLRGPGHISDDDWETVCSVPVALVDLVDKAGDGIVPSKRERVRKGEVFVPGRQRPEGTTALGSIPPRCSD
ncbi:hypothetical protein C8039_05305 [Halogeometricum sp. wsp3]|nr:hypothetical protein C8039_05305 [Halogeometricum sp. wsp3]